MRLYSIATEIALAIDEGEAWGAVVTRVAGLRTLGVGLMLYRRNMAMDGHPGASSAARIIPARAPPSSQADPSTTL